MPQSEAPKFSGTWKALFICPSQKIIRDLAPLLRKHLPTFSGHDLNSYPMRHQLAEVLAAETPNLCLLEISDPVETGLALISDLLRQDAKIPIIVVLSNNDPELLLRCLRQGASDFLIPPFTSEQVEGALQKIARLQPTRPANSGKVYCLMPAKGGCGASTIASSL